jgi:hypothetical protein
MSYTYDIRPSQTPRGGGWNLYLFENGSPAGLVDFPAAEYENAHLDAMKVAFQRAEAEAKVWMKGRKVYSKRRMRLVVHPVAVALLALIVVVSVYNLAKYIF